MAATPTAGTDPRGGRRARERALTAENERLRHELETTKAVLDVAGKYPLLETLSESADNMPRPQA